MWLNLSVALTNLWSLSVLNRIKTEMYMRIFSKILILMFDFELYIIYKTIFAIVIVYFLFMWYRIALVFNTVVFSSGSRVLVKIITSHLM